MRSWIKRHVGLSIVVSIVIILVLICYGASFAGNNYWRIYKMRWAWNKPEKYYITASYWTGGACSRTWDAVWEDHKLIGILDDEVITSEFCKVEDLDIDEWSVDYIFDEVVPNCADGTVYCRVEHDPEFHYPSKVTSVYQYIFTVYDFVACDIDKPSCP